MKNLLKVLSVIAVFVASYTLSKKAEDRKKEKAVIKELATEAYVNGAFNKLYAQSTSESFHMDFAIFSADGEDYPIAKWIESTEKSKADNCDAPGEHSLTCANHVP